MILSLNKIESKEGIAQLNKIGAERKWFLSFYNELDKEFYNIDFHSKDDDKMNIGLCIICKYKDITDCSLFISPTFRRQGFASKIISILIAKFENVQFTISNYNSNSLKLFESIQSLNISSINKSNNTIIFSKNNLF